MDSTTKEAEKATVEDQASLDLAKDAQRLASIVDSSEDAIISKDLNGVIASWNQAAERILGYSEREVLGKPISIIIPPELWGEEREILAKLRAGQKIDHLKTVRMKKDGERIDVSLTISPLRDESGNVVGASKILRDISEQSRAEEARARLAAIVECSEDAIISKDLHGIVTSWNRAAERILGYSSEEVVGRTILLIIPPELHRQEAEILAKLLAGERIDHFETLRMKKSGELIDVSLTISPVKDHNGKVIGAAKILRDITQKKRLEAALRTSEQLASVGRLAASIAHEINNPLEAVTNFVYLARHYPGLPDNVRHYLNCADEELGRVAHIAQQTLGFYRDNSRPAVLRLTDVFEDVLSIYQRKFKHKDLKIERQIERGLTVCAFEGELKQILSNLLMNAAHACPDRGRIVIRARSSYHYRSGTRGVRIVIADNGSGIAEGDQRKIFAPFFTTKKELGTGLGLWITRELLEKKGGSIRFRSSTRSPSGTAMSIYLPTAPSETTTEMVA